jgi:hypothetical protein
MRNAQRRTLTLPGRCQRAAVHCRGLKKETLQHATCNPYCDKAGNQKLVTGNW